MLLLESLLARTGGVRLETAVAKAKKLALLVRIVWFLLLTKHAMRNAVKLLEKLLSVLFLRSSINFLFN